MNAMELTQPNDANLVAQSLAGNRDAFGQIVTRYQTLICALAYSRTGSLTQSEDLAQETFVAAWKQLASLREPHKLRSWLCTIARNIIYDALKKQGREPSHAAETLDAIHESPAFEPQPRDLVISHEEAALLWRSLERIPEIYREPLILFYREHQSIQAVAEKLDLTEDTVKQRLSRGRKLLQGEVLALVVGALGRTNPGQAFTLGVLATLPAMTISAKAATLGAAAKGGAAAKCAGLLGLFGAILTPLFALFSMWLDYRLRRKAGVPKQMLKPMKVYYTGIAVSVILVVLAITVLMEHGGSLIKRSPALFVTLITGLILGYPLAVNLMARKFLRAAKELATVPTLDHATKHGSVWEYRSRLELLGLPLICIRWGGRINDSSPKFVKGWIAMGNFALGGLFAYGGVAIAPICIGACAVGLFSYGAMAVGGIVLGGFGFGFWAFGAFAFGWKAFSGGCAIAWNLAWGAKYAIAHDYALGSGVVSAAQTNTPVIEHMIRSSWCHRVCEITGPWFFWLMWIWAIPMLITAIFYWQNAARRIRQATKVTFTILVSVFAFSIVFSASAQMENFPRGTNLTALVVIKESDPGGPAQQVMISTLQGLVARRSGTQIYIQGGAAGFSIWHNHLNTTYGIPLTTNSNSWSVLAQFKTNVSGYILYDATANSNSLNAATSLCGPLNGIAVDSTIEGTVRTHGITNRLADVRTRDEGWVWTNYNALFRRDVLVEQKESLAPNLRDYATMANAFTFFDSNSPFRTFILNQMSPDAACFGWGDSSAGEDVLISNSSSNRIYTIGSDWALSLSTLSSVRDSSFYQRAYRPSLAPETNVHYVAFVTTDGDNVQWNIGDMAGHFNHPARGDFNMGWSISPALADLAPSVLRWYFDNASNSSNRDLFVAGTSGIGYFYPSMYPAAALDLHVAKLNDFMDRADMDVVHVNDFYSFGRLDLWNKYLAQPNIHGLFYLEYSLYNAFGGAVIFSGNGRPIISARHLLWSGVEEATNVIAKINSYQRDPSRFAGYSLVEVHVWSKTLGDVKNVVTNLAPDVRVVTPDELVRLVRNNVGRKLSFDFSTSAQGWNPGTGGGSFDSATWSSNGGNDSGCLVLSGSDTEPADTNPNSHFWRQIILPQNAATLSFDTRATNDGWLRVRLVNASGVITNLLDWEKLSITNTWVSRTANISNYAGQTVTFYFEQDDSSLGNNGTRFVDNVVVNSAGSALYLPDAPKLLTISATNDVHLLWRNNDETGEGFKMERRAGTNGVWTEIATFPKNTTNYHDLSAVSDTDYFYRIRTWNATGFSAYSNLRQIIPPRRPVLAVIPADNFLELNWPAWASNFAVYSSFNLASNATWSIIDGVTTNVDGSFSVLVPIALTNRFFQLKQWP